MKKYNILKAATWYTVGNVLIRGISFFLLPVFTVLMNTTDYGIYSVYTSYLTIFETVMLLGLSNTVSIAKYSKDICFESYMASIVLIPILLTVIFSIPLNIFVIIRKQLLSMNGTLWNFLFITAAAASVLNIIGARLVTEGRYKPFMIYSLCYVLGNSGISFFLCFTVFKNHDTYMARVIGQCIPNVIVAIVLYLCFTKRQHINIKLIKIAVIWGIPLLFHTAATVLLTQSDRIIIKLFNGYSDAGIYSIAVNIIVIPMVIETSIVNAITPWTLEKLAEKEYRSLFELNNKVMLFFAFLIAEFTLISPEIIHLFTDKAYWDSIYSLIPLSISVFGELLYSMPIVVESINKQTWSITFATITALAINIVLDIVFIKLYGYPGAAYATSISKLILFGMHSLFAHRIDKNSIFSWRYVSGSVIFLILINVFAVQTVKHIVVRYTGFVVIGFIFVGILWKNRVALLALFKSKNSIE